MECLQASLTPPQNLLTLSSRIINPTSSYSLRPYEPQGHALRPGRTGFLMHRNLIRAQPLALGISIVGVYPTEY